MKLLLSILLLFNVFLSQAGHIIGGEMYYNYLGNNQYRFYISMYKDCDPSGNWAPFDQNLILVVYSGSTQYQIVNVPFPGSVNVPVTYNNPCLNSIPPGLCIENAVYSTVLTLPPSPQGYTVSYQRCCRKPQITNIVGPGNTGFTLTSQVPGTASNNYQNSSPRFSNYPPSLLCNNDVLVHNQSATDPDGDQLLYSLVTPFQGGSNAQPQPTALGPPYFPINWLGGYNAPQPLGPGSSVTIDPNTGILTAAPNLTGLFVIGIRVQEVRNGVVISETLLDFLFQVFACNIALSANLPTQEQLSTFTSYCDGLTVQFENNSWSNVSNTVYAWDFGVPGITTDVSNAFEPTYTYPAPGIYQAMMVINPGLPCSDTAWMTVNVNNELEVEWTTQDSVCFIQNSFDFVATTTGPAGTTFEWDFGSGTPNTATGQSVNGVTFNSSGFLPVTVEAFFGVCEAEFLDSIYIFPEPISELVIPANIECEGLTIQFDNNSQASTFYDWDFGVPGINTDVSSLPNPSYTYPGPGTYTVTLVSGTSALCSDTAAVEITLNEELIIAWNSEDSLCITDNSFNFIGNVSGPSHTVYTWDFGPSASIQTSNDIDVYDVSFSSSGTIPITLTGTFDNCAESVTQNIYLWAEPTIDFDIAPGLQCVPFEAHFIDQSWAETTIYYDWDFGDGNTSTEQNPVNIYYDVGQFPVTLTIHTKHGCIDTLVLTQDELVHVRPNPEAGFSLNPDYTDICHSAIQFTDESIGAVDYFYWYDDGDFGTYEYGSPEPFHQYLSDGTHYPMQIVTNEWGCKDSIRNKLYIEPFTFYAPNTFTPDGDEHNNTFLPIVYLGVKSWHLEIFNRWGEIVFESYDLDVGWDGTNRTGGLSQDGTYLWQVTFISCEPIDPERILQGHITLIR